MKAMNASKWLYCAAALMFAGATFQVVDEHWLGAAICFGAAVSFTSVAAHHRAKTAGEDSRRPSDAGH